MVIFINMYFCETNCTDASLVKHYCWYSQNFAKNFLPYNIKISYNTIAASSQSNLMKALKST